MYHFILPIFHIINTAKATLPYHDFLVLTFTRTSRRQKVKRRLRVETNTPGMYFSLLLMTISISFADLDDANSIDVLVYRMRNDNYG